MGRVSGPAPSAASEPDTIPVDTRSAWRREQDRILKQRLEQLQIAQRRGQAPIPAIAASSAPTATPPPALAQTFPSHASGRGYGVGAFFSVALFSALAGAGLMWMTMNSAAQATRPLAATGVAQVSTVAVPEPKPAVQVDTSDSQARNLIEGWRQAWARRDAGAYVAQYSQDFAPANGQTRTNWAEGRQRNFAGKSSIQVTIGGLRIERLSDDRIKAFFLQDYTSGNYRENAKPKTLLLERTGQEWKIGGEWEGDYAITPQATQ
jgi:ketosteroid isomerase-like protein